MKRTCLFFSLFVLLLVTPAEFSDVVGHEPVQVTAGDDVILPCHLDPPLDVTNLTVVWEQNEQNDRTVHIYRHRKDDHNLQDEQFRGRTSLFHHELIKGNISLKLTNVTEDDSGLYICYVPRLDSAVKRGNVLLRVNHFVQVTAGDDVILPCHLDPPFDVSTLTVEWTRNDVIVHVYRHGKDDHDLQDQQFRGRTSLFLDELVKGNISLKLTNVTEDDSGLYICYVPKLNSQVKRGNVLLRVRGDNETQDDKQTGDQTGVIVGSVIGAVILLLLFVIGGFHFDRLKTWWNERWRKGRNNQDDYELGQQGSDEDAAV